MTPGCTALMQGRSTLADVVLVVEDDRDTRELLESVLRLAGFDVVSCVDVPAARVALAQRRPDVVLLDFMLPGEDGLSLCSWLGQNPDTADLPRILYTARDEPAIRRAAREAGCDDFLVKPTPNQTLVERLRRAMDRRR